MIKSLFNVTIALLIAFSMILPTVWQPIKICLLAICLGFASILIFQKKAAISSWVFVGSCVFVTTGLSWAIFGLIKSNPGAIATMTVMVLYPLVLPVLACCFQEVDKEKLRIYFVWIALIIVVFDFSFLIFSTVLPENFFSKYMFETYENDIVIDIGENYFGFTIPNISTTLFMLPFLIVNSFHSKSFKKISLFIAFLMICLIVLSGRRAGFISPIIGVIAAYSFTTNNQVIYKNHYRKIKNIIFLSVVFAITIFLFNGFYGAEYYTEKIYSIFNFTTDNSNIERSIQFEALLSGISNSFIFGEGAGAAANYSRSIEQPWAYELSYVAFIFQYGVLGFTIYALGIFSLVYVLVKNVRNNGRETFEFSFLAGFISFMSANATNPYLAKFDYMWVIFIPLAILNLNFLRNCKKLHYKKI